MKTFLRYAIIPIQNSRSNDSKISLQVTREANALFEQCKKYSINEDSKLVLVPIDTKEYSDIMEYINRYTEWSSGLIYEHKYTKKEINDAEFLLLQSTSMICPQKSSEKMFSKCCDKGVLFGSQEDFFQMKESDIRKKIITGTNAYRYFISMETKEKIISENISNIRFMSVYDIKNGSTLAYQIETVKFLPPLAECNEWRVYKKCEYCGKIIYDVLHKYTHPLYLPKSIKNSLYDFNSTSEIFTEIGARYYVISKRMYEILLDMGAKGLKCEPIIFI